MSGAYDMSGIQATVIMKPYLNLYLPYLLMGINEVYKITEPEKLFRAPYDSLILHLYNG